MYTIFLFLILFKLNLSSLLGQQPGFKDKKIVLLETAKKSNGKDWNKCPFENRVSAITPGSKSFLDGGFHFKHFLWI